MRKEHIKHGDVEITRQTDCQSCSEWKQLRMTQQHRDFKVNQNID